jgi:rubredoxin
LFYLLCLLFVSHHLFKGAKILTTITTNSSRSLSIHLSIIYRSSSSSNETDANRACTNIHQRKGTTSIQSPAGTPFKDLPEDWNCPVCGASKSKFKSIGRQVAGFEQNQGYGFGTNSMTEGEKSKLIYGGLALFFAFFLAGYLLE